MRLLIALLWLTTFLNAHQTGLSYVDIKEDANHKINVVYKKPLSDIKGKDIYVRYPTKCVTISQEPQNVVDGFIIDKFELWCLEEGLLNSKVWVEGLVFSDRGVLMRYENPSITTKSLLRATTPFFHIDHKNSDFELFVEYVNLGVKHIWSGYDHLLFVLSLILLSLNMRALFYSVTAFTLAHSITLAFGIFGIVNIGVAYIEAMIALSIVFLARELMAKKSSFTKRHLGVVAFTFGLLHGFGFSTVLKTIGLPQDEIALSLFSFNLGIEVGQILFILLASVVLYVIRKYLKRHEEASKTYIAYAIGSISSYWLLDRVLSF